MTPTRSLSQGHVQGREAGRLFLQPETRTLNWQLACGVQEARGAYSEDKIQGSEGEGEKPRLSRSKQMVSKNCGIMKKLPWQVVGSPSQVIVTKNPRQEKLEEKFMLWVTG